MPLKTRDARLRRRARYFIESIGLICQFTDELFLGATLGFREAAHIR